MPATRTIVATLFSFVLGWSLALPGRLQAGRVPLEASEKLFALNCAVCHGADGSGATAIGKELKASDLRSAKVRQMSDQELYAVIAKGRKKMPGYEKKLGKEQVQQLTAYLRLLADHP